MRLVYWLLAGRAACSCSASSDLGGAGKVTGLMTEYNEFGALLRQARGDKGLRAAEVARKVAVSPSFLRRVENGISLPSLSVFATLWHLLGFDGNALLAVLTVEVRPAKTRQQRAAVLDAMEGAGPFAAFGRGLAAARLEARLTQAAVGHAVGCRREYVARMEGGHGLPSLRRFAQLRLVLHFDADELLARLGENPPGEPWFAFGQLLAAARVERELSRDDVARVAGCESEDVRAVERGATLPTVLTLARLHKLLRFSGDGALQAVCRADEREAA